MANVTELEQLHVSLVGSSANYDAVMDAAVAKAGTTAQQLEEQTKRIKQEQSAMFREAAALTESVMSPMERYRDLQKRMADMVQAGALSQENYNRVLEVERQKLPAVTAAAEKRAEAERKAAEVQAQKDATRQRGIQITQGLMSAEERYAATLKDLQGLLAVNAISQETFNRGRRAAAAQLPANIAAQQASNQQLARAADITRSLDGPMQRHAAHMRELNALYRAGALDTANYGRAVSAAQSGRAQQVAGAVRGAGQGMQSAGRTASMAVTAPVVGLAAAGFQQMVQFDQAMTKSLAIMDNVTPAMRTAMEEQAKAISMRGAADPTELAKGYYFLASAGYSAQDSLKALAVVSQFAIAGDMQLEQATEQLADAQNALGLKTADSMQNIAEMTRLGNDLSLAANISNTSVSQLADALTNKAATAMRGLKVDVEEGIAVLSAYADQGKKGRVAGEYLDIMLREMQTQFKENNASWQKLGLNIYDTTGKMRPLVDIIRQLEGATAGMSGEQQFATFQMLGFRSESMGAIRPLLGMSDTIAAYTAKLKESGGVMDTVANRQMQSFSNQWANTLNQIKLVGMEIGQILLPYIQQGIAVLKTWVDKWNNMSAASKENIVSWVAWAAAVGPALLILGKITSTAGSVISGWDKMRQSAEWVATAMSGTTVTFTAGAAALLALKVALAAAAVYGAVWMVKEITGQNKWNEEMERSIRLRRELDQLQAKQTKGMVEDFGNVKDPQERLNKINAALKQTRADQSNTSGQVNRATARMAGSTDGSREYLQASDEQSDAEARLQQINARVLALTQAAYQAEDAVTAQKAAADAAAEQAALPAPPDPAIIEENNRLMAEAAALMQGMATPAQKYEESVAHLNDLMTKGVITAEQYNQAMAKFEADLAASDKVAQFNKELENQIAVWGMTSRQAAIYKMELEGATAAQLAQARAADASLTKMEETKKLQDEAKQMLADADPSAKFKEQKDKLVAMYAEGIITADQYVTMLNKAQKESNKGVEIKFKASGIEAVEAGSSAVLERLEEHRNNLAKAGLANKGQIKAPDAEAEAARRAAQGQDIQPVPATPTPVPAAPPPPAVNPIDGMPINPKEEELLTQIRDGIQNNPTIVLQPAALGG